MTQARMCMHGRQLTICAVCAPAADAAYRAAHPSEAEGRTPGIILPLPVCIVCLVPLVPAPAKFEGTSASVGYLPCAQHPNASVLYQTVFATPSSPAHSDEPVSAQDWKTQAEIAERSADRATRRAERAEAELDALRALLPPEKT